ncbi:MAG: hypothetical protein KDD45_08970, partial [Bdellovibrionales bacterium]|nr:hypothetical protein [Bdellovibrionales bacterium]
PQFISLLPLSRLYLHICGIHTHHLLIVTFVVALLQRYILDLQFLTLHADHTHGLGVYLVEPLHKLIGVPRRKTGVEGRSLVKQFDKLFDFLVSGVALHS